MKVAFLHNQHPREQKLAEAVMLGMAHHGDRMSVVPYDDNARDMDADVVAIIGVKCREWVEHCRATGQRFLYFDKGYYYPKEKATLGQSRMVNCWRCSVNEAQPLDFLRNAKCSEDRWAKFGVWPQPWREPTKDAPIVLAGSSVKYHMFNGLPHPTIYHQQIADELRRYTDRPIHYRPKPSWWISSPHEAVPLNGERMAFIPDGPFEDRTRGAHAVVTYGSNAALIGMLLGVPSIILGNGVMRPISSTSLSQIEDPYLATEDERRQLLSNLAYSQWTLREWQSGAPWHHIKTTFLQ